MGRPRKNPDYDPQKIMDGMLDAVVEVLSGSLSSLFFDGIVSFFCTRDC